MDSTTYTDSEDPCGEFGHAWCEAQEDLSNGIYTVIGYVCLVCWKTSKEDPR